MRSRSIGRIDAARRYDWLVAVLVLLVPAASAYAACHPGCSIGEICISDLCVVDIGADRDRDGVPDGSSWSSLDNCPDIANTDQDDLDQDGRGDACDDDDDNDGVPDGEDNCPKVPNPGQADRRNHDGIGDACEPDEDNDGVPDYIDNCLTAVDSANPDQRDTDRDGIGDACEIDADGDGVTGLNDACPVSVLSWCYMDKNFDFLSDLQGIHRPVVGVDVAALAGRKFPPSVTGFDADLDENLPSRQVGTVAATDVNSNETHSFVITEGNDDELFVVDAQTGEVSTTGPLDFEAAAQHVLWVTVTDSGGLSATAVGTVNVTDVNEPPSSLAGFTTSIPEGEPPTVLGTVVGTDPDAGDVLTYSITSGNALGLLAIDSISGEVSTTGPLDFEASPTHSLIVTVTATDVAGLSVNAIVLVHIRDVSEPPSVLPFQASVDENQPPTVLGTIVASDPDAGDVLTFAITSGNDAGLFAIDSNTGELSTTTPLDFDDASQYVLVVSVKDLGGLVTSAQATITVNDVDDPSVPLFVEGDLYLFSTAYPGATTTDTLVKIDPAKPDASTDAAKTVILGLNDSISDNKNLMTYDPAARRLVLYQGLPRQFHFVDPDGTITATLPLGAAPTPSDIAGSCSGRLYYWWLNSGAVSFNYLEADGTVHPVEDGSGHPFTYVPSSVTLVTRMIYDRTTNSLILAHSTGDTGDSQTVLTKYPLDAAGTDVVGPVSASSPFNAALPVDFRFSGTEFPTGLSRGPGNTLLVSVSANTNLGSAQFFTVDPTDMSTATFAFVSFASTLAAVTGTYNHVYSYDAILSTFDDEIRTFGLDANPANVQNGARLTGGVSLAGSSHEAATLIAIGDTIGGGCP